MRSRGGAAAVAGSAERGSPSVVPTPRRREKLRVDAALMRTKWSLGMATSPLPSPLLSSGGTLSREAPPPSPLVAMDWFSSSPDCGATDAHSPLASQSSTADASPASQSLVRGSGIGAHSGGPTSVVRPALALLPSPPAATDSDSPKAWSRGTERGRRGNHGKPSPMHVVVVDELDGLLGRGEAGQAALVK